MGFLSSFLVKTAETSCNLLHPPAASRRRRWRLSPAVSPPKHSIISLCLRPPHPKGIPHSIEASLPHPEMPTIALSYCVCAARWQKHTRRRTRGDLSCVRLPFVLLSISASQQTKNTSKTKTMKVVEPRATILFLFTRRGKSPCLQELHSSPRPRVRHTLETVAALP